MWSTALLVSDHGVRQAGSPLTNLHPPPAPEGALLSYLVSVTGRDWFGTPVAYTGLTITRIWRKGGATWLDPTERQAPLTDNAKQALRLWLIDRSLPAWRDAEPGLRALLELPAPAGPDADPPASDAVLAEVRRLLEEWASIPFVAGEQKLTQAEQDAWAGRIYPQLYTVAAARYTCLLCGTQYPPAEDHDCEGMHIVYPPRPPEDHPHAGA